MKPKVVVISVGSSVRISADVPGYGGNTGTVINAIPFDLNGMTVKVKITSMGRHIEVWFKPDELEPIA